MCSPSCSPGSAPTPVVAHSVACSSCCAESALGSDRDWTWVPTPTGPVQPQHAHPVAAVVASLVVAHLGPFPDHPPVLCSSVAVDMDPALLALLGPSVLVAGPGSVLSVAPAGSPLPAGLSLPWLLLHPTHVVQLWHILLVKVIDPLEPALLQFSPDLPGPIWAWVPSCQAIIVLSSPTSSDMELWDESDSQTPLMAPVEVCWAIRLLGYLECLPDHTIQCPGLDPLNDS